MMIAASCHARPEEEDAWKALLMWGAFEECTREENRSLVGHCGLSSKHVDKPQVNMFYN
jgi:hypothetical protein